MAKTLGSPAPKRGTPHPKSAAARRHPTKPSGKGSTQTPAKPVSSKKPAAYTDRPNNPFSGRDGISGSPAPIGFEVDPKHSRPAQQSPAPAPVPDMGDGNRYSTSAGQIGAVPQPPNPNPNSPSQGDQHGSS
jgi:hypothetical protein